MSLFEGSVHQKAAFLLRCKSTVTALHHQTLTAEGEKSVSAENAFTHASGRGRSFARHAVVCRRGPPVCQDETDKKEKNGAQRKSVRLASQATSVGLNSQQEEKQSAPAWKCVLCLVIDRHLAADIIWPLFPRPAARMPPQALDLCALMSCR